MSVRVVYKQLYDTPEGKQDVKAIEDNTKRCIDWINWLEADLAESNKMFICGKR